MCVDKAIVLTVKLVMYISFYIDSLSSIIDGDTINIYRIGFFYIYLFIYVELFKVWNERISNKWYIIFSIYSRFHLYGHVKRTFLWKEKTHNKNVSVILMSFERSCLFSYYLFFIEGEFSMQLMINKYVL